MEPKKIRLFLPSDLTTVSLRSLACVGSLADDEAQLCEAEATDALEGVWEGLRARTMCTRYKIQNVQGQQSNTRAGGVLRNINIWIHASKIRYRRAHTAMQTLDRDGPWSEVLKPLDDKDVCSLNEQALTKEEAREREMRIQRGFHNEDEEEIDIEPGIVAMVQGEGRRTLSWIWYDPTVSSDDLAFMDAVQVEWCKSRARMLRWKEEVILLVEEIHRMQEFSLSKGKWWEGQKVGEPDMRSPHGLSAELIEGLN
ncbi:hypothetical protein K435DRAFT_681856 [Dendrothele bispora CBS 962.96]|uniref:Uncharacterized protein n=1 Tax=Dendrothele bispora (strain CBS 962.96) TaxID=1314807 RepID=A0A4S8LF38_DENBC|nr:hypothetical protein K435DRAFT_681856 [Dendrothele bispora CBS 962.96]